MGWSDPVFWQIVLGGMFRLAVPIFLAALGEMITERAGAINLGIDGVMTAGAFAAVYFAWVGGWEAGLAGALATGAVCGLVFAVAILRFRAHPIIVGIALSLIGAGLTSYLFQLWQPSGQSAVYVPLVPSFTVSAFGAVLVKQNLLTYATAALLALAVYLLGWTRLGIVLRAVGDDPEAALVRGVDVVRVRYAAFLIGGALMGLAGASITLGVLGAFNDDLTNGRGYVALAVVIIGRWTPVGAVLGALLFAFFDSLGLRAQNGGAHLPTEFFSLLPYAMTLLVLVLTARSKTAPRTLG